MATALASCAGAAPAESLVEAIYATIGDDARWQAVLRRLCDDFSSRCAALARYDFSTNTGEVLHQAPSNSPLIAVYAHRGAVNPWFLSRQYYAAGQVIAGHDIISRDEFLRTDFYREVLRPHGLFHRLCGVLSRTSDQVLYVVLHRRKEQEDFSVGDQQRLGALLPHLVRALAISARLRAAEVRTRMLSCLVSSQAPRLFVVDAAGGIVYASIRGAQGGANAVAGRDKTACVSAFAPTESTLRERLGLEDKRERATLDAMLRAMSTVPPGPPDEHPHGLRVYSVAERCWLQLSLRRLRLAEYGGVEPMPALFVVTVANPLQDEAAALNNFARRFALSPAQSRVSELILKGHTPHSAASALHLSANTVRSHLKQIFLKTNTHRQVELVSLLKQMP